MTRRFLVSWIECGGNRTEAFSTARGAERYATFILARGFWPHTVETEQRA